MLTGFPDDEDEMEGPGGGYHKHTPEESAQFWNGFCLGAGLIGAVAVVVGLAFAFH